MTRPDDRRELVGAGRRVWRRGTGGERRTLDSASDGEGHYWLHSAASIGDPGLIADIEHEPQRTGADPSRLVFDHAQGFHIGRPRSSRLRWRLAYVNGGRVGGGDPAGVLTCPELFRVSEHPASPPGFRGGAPDCAQLSGKSSTAGLANRRASSALLLTAQSPFRPPGAAHAPPARRVQQLMRDEAIAAVEQACGRRVRLVMSDIAPDDDVAIQLFLFEPDGG